MSGEGDGDGDWSDSLFKPEKGDSLGDGSWGRKSDEPALAPVAWDKLPPASERKPRARLATPAPGSQKGSGLLDIKALAPDLAKSMNSEAGSVPRRSTPSPAPGAARLATAAKGSTGSGLIDVQELVKAQEEQQSADNDRERDIIASNAAASMSGASMSGSSLSTSLVDLPAVPLEDSSPSLTAGTAPGRGPLLAILGILAVAVVGLAAYVLTQ